MTTASLWKNKEQVSLLKQETAKGVVTLVYGARDQEPEFGAISCLELRPLTGVVAEPLSEFCAGRDV